MSTAELVPTLDRAFGRQGRDITEYPTWMVVKAEAYLVDKARLMDWTNHYLQTAPAKS